ncbi:MAG: hypothetical protein V2I63_01805 [Pseudomonadales bacterium]|jgi:hypothetical protein|nr:hypothetical protein [Pseudomonadales bacterium]
MTAETEEERYLLSFRGEILEGQHGAVVKQRLQALLKVDDARADALFSGQAIVVKREADRDTAARYQAAFRKAGARLRIARAPETGTGTETASPPAAVPRKPTLAERLAAEAGPVASMSATSAGVDDAAPAEPQPVGSAADDRVRSGAAPSGPGPAAGEGPDAFTLAPTGSDLLAQGERPAAPVAEIPTDHLSAAPPNSGSLEDVLAPAPTPLPPDVSHLRLMDDDATPEVRAESEPATPDLSGLSLAALGADLETLRREAPVAVVVPDFELVDPDQDAPARAPAAPPPPSTDHLELVSERARFDTE